MEEDLLLREMQYRLEQAEGSLSRLLNRLPGMAYRCRVSRDFDYILEFVSKGCETMLGMGSEEVLAAHTNIIEQMMKPEDLLVVRKVMQDNIVDHKHYDVFYRIEPVSGGAIKWIWDQGEGVYDDSGNCLFIEGIMMDVTDQKKYEQHLWEENRQLRSSIKNSYGLGEIVGKSEVMQNCYRFLLRAAKSDTNVVLYGETGVGKDLAARTIHELSGIKGRFVPVNCAAIPEQLLESEFFGHVKGAFSGAVNNHSGYLASANGGTLFLDEIGELPLKLQGKLLRAIENKSFTPVGSNEVRQSSFRLISATNRNLSELVREKEMRPDFYYRIHVLSVTIPPLRERSGDLTLLIDAYAQTRSVEKKLPPGLLLAMEQYSWPGNVRELQNALDRYWAFGEMDLTLGALPRVLACFPADSASETRGETGAPQQPQTADPEILPLSLERDELEKQRILSMLQRCEWKKGKTAEALGITMRTLQRKLKRYDISR